MLPAGSGNALSASLLYRSGESFELLSAVFALVKGCPREMDIASVVNTQKDTMYAFLSLTWTFMAECDVDSEKYRMFGGGRFMMVAFMKLLSSHKRHNGTLRYLVAGDEPEPHCATASGPPRYHDQIRDPLTTKPAMDCFTAEANENQQDWRELTGPFHIFSGMNVSHTGADCFVTPPAVVDDGYFHLFFMAGAVSRWHLTQVVLSVEDGSHVGVSQMQLVKTRAFSVLIGNLNDVVCVDGERFQGPEVKVGAGGG